MRTVQSTRLAAWSLMVAFTAILVLPALSARHLAADPDALFVQVQRSASVGHADDGVAGDVHCPVCHWLRAISGASAQPTITANAPLTVTSAGLPARTERRGRSQVPALPSRAPPAPAV